MEFDYSWFTTECMNRIEYYSAGSKYNEYALDKNWLFWQRDQRRREPVFFGVAFCIADKIYSPTSGEELGFPKQEFGFVMCVIDIFIILISIFMINLLEVRYKEYAKIFDKRNVEMRDFTVQLYHLPNDHTYGGKELFLSCYLWQHIEEHVRKYFEGKVGKNEKKKAELQAAKPWQIVDINFGKMD